MIPCQCQGPAATGSAPVHLNAFKSSRKSNLRLNFDPSITVHPIDCKLTKTEKFNSFYSKDELNAFSLEVRAIRAEMLSAVGTHATELDCMFGLEAEPTLRGLELHLCLIRVRNKKLAQMALLKKCELNAKSNKTSEERLISLAAASAKLSRWSRLVAMETARLDSLRACADDYMIPIIEPVHIKPFPGTIKRRRVTDDEYCRPAKK